MIIAVDPGLTIGIAIKDGDSITTTNTREPEELYKLVRSASVVVCEDFQTAGRINRWGLHTVRIIGGLEALAEVYGYELHIRMPQHRYQALSRARAQGRRLVHEVDALAHLIAWLDETPDEGEKNARTVKDGRRDASGTRRKLRRGRG